LSFTCDPRPKNGFLAIRDRHPGPVRAHGRAFVARGLAPELPRSDEADPLLHFLPEIVRDDAQPAPFFHDPVLFRIEPRDAFAGRWVLLIAANPHTHGEGPHLERLIVKYVPDLTVLFTQFQTGDIDYIGLQGITPDHYEEAKKLADRMVTPVPQAFIENIALNLGKPAFKDPAVREALYLAMDKKSIIEQIYYGLPTPTESYLPRQSWAFNPDLPQQIYDPEKAKKLLDEAGWKPGSDGVREKDGVRLEFTNSTTAGNHVREQAQQLLQQNWADIGAKMTISNLPPAVMWGDYWMLSKFESAMVGIDFMVGPDPDATDYFSSKSIAAKGGGGQNTCQYMNPLVDACLAEGASSADPAKRKAAYLKMQEQTREDLPYLPIFQYAMVQGTKNKLQGFAPNVNVQENCWNANTWYWA
jgi:peptide/nickel transport system substrate-binding protein